MRLVLALLSILIATSLTTAPALAVDTKLLCPKKLPLAFYELGVIYHVSSSEGAVGIDKEFVDLLASRTGCQFSGYALNRQKTWAELRSGTMTMTTSAAMTPERGVFLYGIPYYKARNFAIMPKSLSNIKDPQAFISNPQLAAVVARGFRHGPGYDEVLSVLEKNGRNFVTASEFLTFVALSQDRGHLIINWPVQYRHFLATQTVLEPVFHAVDWAPSAPSQLQYLMISKKHFSPAAANAWRAVVLSLIADGSIDQILEKYAGKERYGLVAVTPAEAGLDKSF